MGSSASYLVQKCSALLLLSFLYDSKLHVWQQIKGRRFFFFKDLAIFL